MKQTRLESLLQVLFPVSAPYPQATTSNRQQQQPQRPVATTTSSPAVESSPSSSSSQFGIPHHVKEVQQSVKIHHTLLINNTTLICPIEVLFGAKDPPGKSLIPDIYDPNAFIPTKGMSKPRRSPKKMKVYYSVRLPSPPPDKMLPKNKSGILTLSILRNSSLSLSLSLSPHRSSQKTLTRIQHIW